MQYFENSQALSNAFSGVYMSLFFMTSLPSGGFPLGSPKFSCENPRPPKIALGPVRRSCTLSMRLSQIHVMLAAARHYASDGMWR
ncbi:hypothetical protein OBBRIDRAFT_789882 [Obba rivulosa]|uniref:Uncharacterized protein n=1 Tax=Obba rivulosa TaxID=1052685 RepID=A0A8E2DQD2_9APHY|nr:hypothetical protein OBBRIDRAFT_789882 [Obba rivulosa]